RMINWPLSSESEAKANPNTASDGRMIRRGPNLSSNAPRSGEQMAIPKAATAKASETASLDQPNSTASGLRNTPKVKTSSDEKLTKTATPEPAATRQPG